MIGIPQRLKIAFFLAVILGNILSADGATGGAITTILVNGTNYTVHTFKGSGTFTASAPMNVSVLVVAGGGQGGRNGGGGAGGLIYNASYPVSAQSYTVTVGAGGNAYSNEQGANGGNSIFGTLTTIGGGGGAGRDYGSAAFNGGSGGGGGGSYSGNARLNPGSGTSGQGRAGGYGAGDYGCASSGGGGGGAGASGTNGASGASGNGGAGLNFTINGSNAYYAGGGGGSIVCQGSGSNGAGGIGGGGAGNSGAGIANTGGGGGGSAMAGGSGIIIVRYVTSLPSSSSSDVPFSLSAVSGGQFLVIKNGIAYTVNSSVPINDNVWHHVVATYDNTTMRIYVDGSLAGNASYGFGALPTNGLPVFIGRNYDSANSSGYFNGSIDEVAVFNRSLNASEIQQMYNYTKDGLGTYFTVPLSVAATFGGSSTNLSTVPDPSNVTSLILEKPGKGRISFPPSHSVNTVGQDYDTNVIIDTGYVSVNSSGLDPTFNSSTTITINATGLYSGSGTPGLKYYPGFAPNRNTILSSGIACTAPRCTGLTWNSTSQILTFNVTGFSGYALYDNSSGNMTFVGWTNNATLGINITSTNQIAIYTSSSKNNSAFSFVPVTPPAAGSVTLMSNESSNTTSGELGFLVENQGNVNVSITVASDKDAAAFIGGSTPLFQMFGAANESGACAGLNTGMQNLGASAITVCPSLAFPDAYDTIWAYILSRINSDSPPQANTAILTFTSTQV